MPSRTPARSARPTQTSADREQRFVDAYVLCFNQAEAARRAGLGKSSKELGYQMMQRPSVRAAVDRKLAEISAKLETQATDVLREIARLAMFDPGHVTAVSCPEDIANLPEDVRRAIVGWGWDKHGNFTVKLAKEGALEMLGRHHGLFKDRVEHSGHVTVTATPLDTAL